MNAPKLASSPPHEWAAAPRLRVVKEDPMVPMPIDEPRISIFATRPASLTARSIDDLWERHGSGRLYVVASAERARAADVLGATALGHRPELIVAGVNPGELRDAVVLTMLRLRAGDVLLVVTDDPSTLPPVVAQGRRWRASIDVPEGELHSLFDGAGDAL